MHAQPVFEKIAIEDGNDTGPSLLEKVKNASKSAAYDTVYVLGSEGGDYTPSEVLAGHNILTHLPEIIKDFDYIFLEGPPLNDFSDSRELSQYVEGVIAVFSAEHVIKQIDKESLTFLNDLNGKFYGSILNMVDLENVNIS
jgi:Mrp family chromosome partitioning ATPase